MADLEGLIRVRKHAIEQKQKALALLYRQAEDLKQQRDELETQLAIEAEKAKEMPADMQGFFGNYATLTTAQIENIDRARKGLESKVMAAQDEMRRAFGELKKIEIIDERRKAELLAEIDKKEAALMDDIAIDGFMRKQDE